MDANKLPERELRREEILHYVKWDEKTGFVLANKGLTDWTQSMNPNTDDNVQYIAEKNSESKVLGYAPSVSYSGTAYPGDPFNYWIYTTGKNEVVGATFEEVEIETFNPVSETEGTYVARRRTYEVQPSNPGSGEGGGKIAIEGTFAQKGSVETGIFNIKEKTFTADETSGVNVMAILNGTEKFKTPISVPTDKNNQ